VTFRSDPRLEGYAGTRAVITGGLGLIGSAIARRLVALGAEVLLVDSMIPEYGGNPANIARTFEIGSPSTSPIFAAAMLCGIFCRVRISSSI
jgi:nucleoside-diphosphate-sugar epimerase